MITRIVETPIHGRLLYEERSHRRLLVGFHGYAESAESSLAEMEQIPGAGDWSLLAVQALHPFYTRSGAIVASWMTSLDREHAIIDNLAWVRRALASAAPAEIVVFCGFSQGAAMAARAASHIRPCAGAILLGGDIPPEIKDDAPADLPPFLLGRGTRDEWYTDEKFKNDLSFLEQNSRVSRCVFAGGHEWSEPFREAAGDFLRMVAAG